MQQSSPPYLWAAQQYPRQIDQWDDINAQNGRLQRTKTFITLSPFNVTVNWIGVSDIVAAWNFEAPNNFSLLPYTAIANTNYVLCISYRVGNVLTRYILWNAVGSVMPQDILMYTGQTILKNCRLEVWSTNVNSVTEANGMQFNTSVLGALDYRYGYDTPLQIDDGENTNLSELVETPGASITRTDQWKAINCVANPFSWAPSFGTGSAVLNAGLPIIALTPQTKVYGINGLFGTLPDITFTLSNAFVPSRICFTFNSPKQLGYIILLDGSNNRLLSIRVGKNAVLYPGDYVDMYGIGLPVPYGTGIALNSTQMNGCSIDIVGTTATITGMDYTGIVGQFTANLASSANVASIQYQFFDNFTQLDVFNTPQVNTFPVPITFPSGSISTTN